MKADSVNYVVAALVLVAGLLRFFLSFEMQVMNVDAIALVDSTGSFYDGITFLDYLRTVPGYWHPLYPALCLFADLFFDDIEFSGKLVSVVSGTGLVLILFLLARRLYGISAALLTLCITALYPVLIYYSSFTTTEMTYLSFLFAGLFFFVKWAEHPGTVYATFMGFCTSAAYLTRPEGIFFMFQLLFMGGLVAGYKKWRHREPFFPYGKGLFACVIAFLLLSSPYLLHLKKEEGRWTFNRGGGFAFALTQETVESKVWSLSDDKKSVKGYFDECYKKLTLLQVLKEKPAFIIGKWTSNFKHLMVDILPALFVHKFFLVLAIMMMLAALIWNRDLMHKHVMLIFLLTPMLITPLYVIELRTQIYIIPIAVLLASVFPGGIVDVACRNLRLAQVTFSRKAAPVAFGILLTCGTFFYYRLLVPSFAEKGSYGLEQKKAGLWLKENGYPKGKVMARKPWVAYYSRNEILPLPLASFKDTMQYARENNAGYLVIDDQVTTRIRPSVAFLLEGSSDDLNLLYDNGKERGLRVRLFSLVHPKS